MSLADKLKLTPEKIEAVLAAIRAVPTVDERLNAPKLPPPKVWVPVKDAARQAFFEKLGRCKAIRHHGNPFEVSQLHRAWGGQCVYCGRHLPHPYDVNEETPRDLIPCREHLVPLAMGCGAPHKAVLACIGCNTSKSNRDFLDFNKARSPAVRKKLLALRMGHAHAAFNHWARDPKVHTPLMVGRMLDARWQHPRFKMYAAVTDGGAFVGWKSSWPMPQAALFILKGLKGKFVSKANHYTTLNVFEFDHPEDAIQAIWELIEQNAWVLGFDLEAEGYVDITPATSPTWRFWSPNFRDLCRRELTKDRPRWKSRWKPKRRRRDA